MRLFVDTSVWSGAFRKGTNANVYQIHVLKAALMGSESVFTTGLVLQELLQGFNGPKAEDELIAKFKEITLLVPNQETHIKAAQLRNHCRRNGVQAGTVDALLAQLCIENELAMLTTDNDFIHIARFSELKLWTNMSEH